MSGRLHTHTGEGWDGILMPSETILWQGRPDPSFQFGVAQAGAAAFGLLFAGFAAVWMLLASTAGGYFWTFGLIHFSVGVGLAFGAFLYPPWRRRHTWYTLTNRRAFIATDLPMAGRKLKSWPIHGDTEITYHDGAQATIHFANDFRQTKNGTRKIPIGFERITEGDEVHRLMCQVRDERRAAEAMEEAAQ
ncbi:aspartate carbamoyltransferase catalytic subunit [Pseudooceanicola sp.]|uniref:aspartate carbamoyltransferase catalytic subunit n=1 Tax=Pseudooceanicola sp. TaxID=1914328 RepID=UPI0035C6C213